MMRRGFFRSLALSVGLTALSSPAYCDQLTWSFADLSQSFNFGRPSDGYTTVTFQGLNGTLTFPTLSADTNPSYVFDRVPVGFISKTNFTNPDTGQPDNLFGFNLFPFDIALTIDGVTQSTGSQLFTASDNGFVADAVLEAKLPPPPTFYLADKIVVFTFYTSPNYANGGEVDGIFNLYPSPVTSPIPEPSSYALLLVGLAVLAFATRQHRQRYAYSKR
ncbi:PEP-CTERM sorting domain-containing protein [Alphaproteobacteria bacterium]|nr:PEP-CTERM sorting domain-containing protein [Alphaproteobacteria bacterium]